MIIYGLYFILYPYFSYQAIILFFQQYNQMLYGFLNREYDTVLQTQDEVFFQNNQRNEGTDEEILWQLLPFFDGL